VGLTWLASSHLLLLLQQEAEELGDKANFRSLLKLAVETENPQDCPQEIDQALPDLNHQRKVITTEVS